MLKKRFGDDSLTVAVQKHLQTRAEILNRAPAAHPETTGRRALEKIESKNTGRVARERADFRIFQHPLRQEGHVTGRFVTSCDRAVLAQQKESC